MPWSMALAAGGAPLPLGSTCITFDWAQGYRCGPASPHEVEGCTEAITHDSPHDLLQG